MHMHELTNYIYKIFKKYKEVWQDRLYIYNLDSHALQYKCTCTQYSAGAACTKNLRHARTRAIASERERAEVYPVYDHYQMYMYMYHRQGKAQIVHMGNTKISRLVYRFKTSNCHYRNLRVEYVIIVTCGILSVHI